MPLAAALGHQGDNARELVNAGAARLAPSEAGFPALLAELIGNPEGLVAMGEAARTLARPDAAARIADLVEESAS